MALAASRHAAEPRWDVRIFRACSLLEAIASEVLPSGPIPIVDNLGVALCDHEGKPATTAGTRGSIYALVRHCLNVHGLRDATVVTHPSQRLWDEVGVWVDVRHSVAHEGLWAPPPLATGKPARRGRVAAAFTLAGRGDGLDAGWLRYADTSTAAVEAVLRAAVTGLIFPPDAN